MLCALKKRATPTIEAPGPPNHHDRGNITMTAQDLTTPRLWRDQLERAHAVRQTTDDEHEFEDASDRFWDAVDGITARRCTTAEALAVKARAVRLAMAPELAGGGTDVKLLLSLLDDLESDGARA